MIDVIWATPLYEFLRQRNASPLEKTIRFFMTKPDIAQAMGEIERVLEPEGLCYVNSQSVDDPDDRLFCETSPPSRLLKSERFAKHKDDEADAYFEHFGVLRKAKTLIDKAHGGRRLK